MQADSWLVRWRSGRTGFHQSTVDHHLQTHWASLGVPSGARVLMPLCGKSLDVAWLRDAGHTVVGIDISPIAIEGLLQESGILARRGSDSDAQRFAAPRLTAICGDFFDIARFGLGIFPVVYDRAAFTAMAAQYRAAYLSALLEVTDIGSRILMTLVEYPQQEFPGPPFSITADELRAQVAPRFSVRVLDRLDVLSADARMQARGVTRLHEVCCLLERMQ